MSSSGLIYAVIVGAWAAYLVPMWLRRQDELNEARPTERFSTAIRLLAGRSALERRASRALGDEPRDDEQSSDDGPPERDEAASGDPAGAPADRDDREDGADREAEPRAEHPAGPGPDPEPGPEPAIDRPAERPVDGADRRAGTERRARLLARRRRMVSALFLAFALGAVVAAVAGLAFLWVPAVPAVLLTLYIGHLRKLERQRYEVKLDRARAAQAAERLRQRERQRTEARAVEDAPAEAVEEPVRGRAHLRLAADPAPAETGPAGSASAVAEATEHEEWVDGMRERAAAGPDSWEPVPVPLPTYVTAPVAPRVSRGLDLSAPGTWTAGRPAEARAADARAAEARTTPLFDQYADPSAVESRPRAANE
ncbi:gephyrin-like molybdotransferase receptor GlpR [Kitasatospora sp. NPDC090091]|uniref:divisome protein SepX/GlpR n=1 Tax=Kitasatospora sp. NPDC090091 TaxID=3364081 RepID=UPI00380DD1BE